jgi:hypothetical protein
VTTAVDPEGSRLVHEALAAIGDGVALVRDDDVRLLGQALTMSKVRELLSAHGEVWPDLSSTLGGAPLREVLRLLAVALTELWDAAADCDDPDGVSRYGGLARRVELAHDDLAARAAARRAEAAS